MSSQSRINLAGSAKFPASDFQKLGFSLQILSKPYIVIVVIIIITIILLIIIIILMILIIIIIIIIMIMIMIIIIIIIIIIIMIIMTRVPSCKLHDREIVHALPNQRRLRPFGECTSRLGHLVQPNTIGLHAWECRATAEIFLRNSRLSAIS